MKILGREPTLWIQTISAILSVLVTFNLDALSAEQAALVVAAISAGFGVANGLAVRPPAPAVFTGLIGALAALATGYGFTVDPATVGSVQAAVVTLVMFATRIQVTPATAPRPVPPVSPQDV